MYHRANLQTTRGRPTGARIVVFGLTALLCASCGGEIPSFLQNQNRELGSALPPLASAGADREILRGTPTRLEGGGTYHPQGANFTVRWEQISGTPVILSNANDATPSFLAPLDEQELRFAVVASDGLIQTRDEVRLLVRASPSAVAPRIRAGADRDLPEGEPATPNDDDILGTVSTDVTTTWAAVMISEPDGDTIDEEDLPASVFRLVARRGELSSAPDYLILHPRDPQRTGEQAPVANITGPDLLEPGESFTVDATGSSDPNGDSITWRWEQVRGDPLVTGDPLGDDGLARQSFDAPARPQEIVLRVYASDGRLESAPSQLSVVVAPTNPDDILTIAPRLDGRVHPGNLVVLDALRESSTPAPMGATYEWVQTNGTSLTLDKIVGEPTASFIAPEAPADLAFRVTGVVNGVETAPVVSRVTVVAEADNEPPGVFLCASNTQPSPGQVVIITANIADPELDVLDLSSAVWDATSDGLSVQIDPVLPGAQNPLCTNEITSNESPYSAILEQELMATGSGDVIEVELQICDMLGACDEGSLELEVQ